ncbi:DUF1464 family protein [Aquisphaera insulae]|uniref:DUF1464 family protein n=1 Tax=Aquisphaera insulae TaxID=2712864 RepID=UPI0013ED35DF|nr:DUF1464 family protein [Aquisphaera insulae]
MIRVVGTDPGTSSLDLILLEDGLVREQVRFEPAELRANPGVPIEAIRSWAPIDLVAGPSGYGLPLVRGHRLDEDAIDQMSLVRPDERGEDHGVVGFRASLRAFAASGLPVVFLPGGWHLPTIPAHRKVNAVDLGTADKVAVAALALEHDAREHGGYARSSFALVEVGSAFTAVLVVREGRLVDASAGTRGPIGLKSGGAWDGELACWRSPLSKRDLFRGGLDDLGPEGPAAFRESLRKAVAGLRAVTTFERIYLSGAGLDRPGIEALVHESLDGLGRTERLPSLPDAWVKHAAQGSALLADALAGGRHGALAASLQIEAARGCLWDALARP